MKVKKWQLILSIAFFIIGVTGYALGHRPDDYTSHFVDGVLAFLSGIFSMMVGVCLAMVIDEIKIVG